MYCSFSALLQPYMCHCYLFLQSTKIGIAKRNGAKPKGSCVHIYVLYTKIDEELWCWWSDVSCSHLHNMSIYTISLGLAEIKTDLKGKCMWLALIFKWMLMMVCISGFVCDNKSALWLQLVPLPSRGSKNVLEPHKTLKPINILSVCYLLCSDSYNWSVSVD